MDFYKELYILDASVLIKWFTHEEHRENALKLRADFLEDKIEIGTPTLTFYEIMNYATRKDPGRALLFLSQIQMLNMTNFFQTIENTSTAMEIMIKFPKISFYDAIYHAIAINHNGTFITADEKYYQITKRLKHIKLLKDYK